ncbi:tryptophan 7-halogenase (plasmid) [Bradyrhizobium septentrionale]|uniref:Tryptophan 7-halogenase n=1 Tax=Bradyrhizobium septentrionale TaxID=1404411 RepID=A0A973WAX6_9BRAD|nr:tryptophan 7-halogenase [Bradyrhizobium septentrionale]UGY11964.1 tryptophan 7-halogenase [Bradyrhizobium septentrionale]UGY30165.1 tryptophan 7-halogenase [Bradyrhizobium septentrionale]
MNGAVEILVVGGGPAGSVSALMLRRLGFRVRLIETSDRPRPHVGEAISLGVHRQLTDLGLGEALDRAGCRSFDEYDEHWERAEAIVRQAPPGSATIDRARFDAAFWSLCSDAGVEVRLGQQVERVDRLVDGGWNVRTVGGERYDAAFLIDATGRRSLLPRARRAFGPRTLALHGYWRGEGLPTRPHIAAGASCWTWGAPVDGLGFSAILFVDRHALAEHGPNLREAYARGLAKTGLLSLLANRANCSVVSACDASAWLDDEACGRGFIKVGEAAQSLDPLASMGVQKAIQSARSAAVIVNTLLRRPDAQSIALTYHQDLLKRSAHAHRRATAEIYARSRFADMSFWQARCEGANARVKMRTPTSLSFSGTASIKLDMSRLIEHPCLCGDYVELRPAVLTGSEREPVAFLGDATVAGIVAAVRSSATWDALRTSLAHNRDATTADHICAWLVHNKILHVGAPA